MTVGTDTDDKGRAVDAMRNALYAAWTPRLRLAVSDIAEKHRVIPSDSSSAPGAYRVTLTPYTKEIQDRLNPDDPVQVVVYEAAAQAGSKSTVGENWVLAVAGGFYPARMLYALDTDSNAQDWSKDSLDTMIQSSALLRERVRNSVSRSKNETILGKWFTGGRLRIVGAHSASALCRMAAKYCVLDECDRYKENPGYEGNAVSLVLARQTTYGPARKAYICSTPTVEDNSEIHEWFLRGDQRYFHVPCPSCGEMQRLEWRDESTKEYRLVWPKGHPDEAHYVCAYCSKTFEEHEKNRFLPDGRWIASRPDLGGGMVTSYNLNCLYAPLGWLSWPELAAEWESTNVLAKTGNIEKLRSFVNIRLAQVFSPPGEALDAHFLATHVEPDWGDEIPEGVRVITIGTDVHDNRLETMVVGWGVGWEAWILDYAVIWSDPRMNDAWSRHDELIREQRKTEDYRKLRAAASCVDSGYLPQTVLEYTQRRRPWNVFAIKGVDSKGAIWDKKIRNYGRNKTKGTFFAVHVNTAKDDLQAAFRITTPGPKYIHIPDRLIEEHPDLLDQLSSEHRVKTRNRKGREVVEWKKITESRRNEAWDCMVYALAAAHCLTMGGLRLDAPTKASQTAQRPARPIHGSRHQSPVDDYWAERERDDW